MPRLTMARRVQSSTLPPCSRNWALFLDIDGTLLELAEKPDAVVIPNGLPGLLDDLRAGLDSALALISGRDLMGIDRLFMTQRFDASGSHGHEWRLGQESQTAGSSAAYKVVAAEIEACAHAMPEVLFEGKQHSLALHFRGAPEKEADVLSLAQKAQARLGKGYKILSGKSVVEVLPADANKGAAIARYMRHAPYFGRIPVFLGDDVTDESGFKTVNAMGGVSVVVGSRTPSEARYRLASPSAVIAWLEDTAASLLSSVNEAAL